ncbi:MAG: HAD family hydrolase [Nitrososphaerota archaeon]|nr:HAD family hydrolase [Nitrososphaerota archaeon]MDG6923703.1 HAD family hydrolase [Nitrososphaerota archaeon]
MNKLSRAIFIDRDGVINDLVYRDDEGHIGSPMSAKQLTVFPFAAETIKRIQAKGYLAIVVSNQPGVAKKQFTFAELQKMNQKIKRNLAKSGVSLDGEYYCLHHPNALIKKYKVNCDCRKPKPGLLLRAAKERRINLKDSYFVGDAISDVKAGKAAGCRTVLIGNMTDLLNRVITQEKAEPDYLIGSLKDVIGILS